MSSELVFSWDVNLVPLERLSGFTCLRKTVYTLTHYLPFYKRYVDDGATLARSEEHATEIFNSIARQDPDGRLEWEVDFPRTEESFTPFLSTQIRVDEDGIVHSKFYRKKQKKNITLHYLSQLSSLIPDESTNDQTVL